MLQFNHRWHRAGVVWELSEAWVKRGSAGLSIVSTLPSLLMIKPAKMVDAII